MSKLRKQIENELAEFLYTGVAEFNGVENGNFPLARKILTLSSLRDVIEKAEKWNKLIMIARTCVGQAEDKKTGARVVRE